MKNKNVVYTGKVGAKAAPRRGPLTSKRTPKSMFTCQDGPLMGYQLCLQEDGATLPICIKGQFGHYQHGKWVPAINNVELAAA